MGQMFLCVLKGPWQPSQIQRCLNKIILFNIKEPNKLWKKQIKTIHQLSWFMGHPLLKDLSFNLFKIGGGGLDNKFTYDFKNKKNLKTA